MQNLQQAKDAKKGQKKLKNKDAFRQELTER
jgi:hypothetical protein